MKKSISYLLFSLSIPVTAAAQLQYSIGGGAACPSAPQQFADTWKTGITLEMGLELELSPSLFVFVQATHSRCAVDENAYLSASGFAGTMATVSVSETSVSAGQAGVKAILGPALAPVRPFVSAAAGYAYYRTENLNIFYTTYHASVPKHSESAFSLSAGTGLQIPFGRSVDFFVEGNYLLGFTSGESTGFILVRGGLLVEI